MISTDTVINEFVLDSLDLAAQWETFEILSSTGKQQFVSIKIANVTSVIVPVFNLNKGLYYAILRKRNGEKVSIKFIKL